MPEKSNETLEQILRGYLVSRRAEQFSFLASLVRVNSENPPGDVTRMVDKLKSMLGAMGFEVTGHPVDADAAAAIGREVYDNLVVTQSFGASPESGPHVVLAAQADTLPAGAGWSRDPQGAVIDEGRMFGRGVSEGKGDLAAYVLALQALRDCATELSGRISLMITFDGATGGDLGFQRLLADASALPDFAVVPGVAEAIGTTATGVLDLDVEIRGQAAPPGVPHLGADAIEATAAILRDLYKYRDSIGQRRSEVEGIGAPTLVVTEMSGGNGALSVPDRVDLVVDRRLLPEEDAGRVQSEITNIIGRAVVSVPGAICKVRRRRLLPAVVPGPSVDPLLERLRAAGDTVSGTRPGTFGTAFETPIRDFAKAGVPVVMYGAGNADSGGHMAARADEWLKLDSLRTATEVLVLALAEMLGAPATGDQESTTDP